MPHLEIDQRVTAEMVVTAWYIQEHDLVLLSLVETRKNRGVEFVVEPDKVADALQHPYSYAEQMGVEFPAESD